METILPLILTCLSLQTPTSTAVSSFAAEESSFPLSSINPSDSDHRQTSSIKKEEEEEENLNLAKFAELPPS
jgi:hypothetical protein